MSFSLLWKLSYSPRFLPKYNPNPNPNSNHSKLQAEFQSKNQFIRVKLSLGLTNLDSNKTKYLENWAHSAGPRGGWDCESFGEPGAEARECVGGSTAWAPRLASKPSPSTSPPPAPPQLRFLQSPSSEWELGLGFRFGIWIWSYCSLCLSFYW